MVWDWRVSKAEPMLFYWPKRLYIPLGLLPFFILSSFCPLVGIVGQEGVGHYLPALHCRPLLIIIIIIIIIIKMIIYDFKIIKSQINSNKRATK